MTEKDELGGVDDGHLFEGMMIIFILKIACNLVFMAELFNL